MVPLLGHARTDSAGGPAIAPFDTDAPPAGRRPRRDPVADLRAWVPDLAVAAIVAFLGLYEAATAWVLPGNRVELVFVAIGTAAAVGLSRRLPAAALALVWGVCGLQLLAGIDLMLVQVTIAAVAFGTARWGSTVTVWLSALSIPLAGLIVIAIVNSRGLGGLAGLAGNESVVDTIRELSTTWQLTAALIGAAALGAPWLAGLTLRFGDRARLSRASQEAAEEDAARAVSETEQAREIARLREDQARLANDVHDVVGHSLAVILAQAESAQYLDDTDPKALKDTMAKIATSARTSLRDVRQVLADTQQPDAPPAGLDTLVDGVRASGHEVVSTEIGVPRPLPPELEVVAFRVLQEMLTNAIKHGRRDTPVEVERHWEGELRIEVRNVVAPSPFAASEASGGAGLDGMRRRLESVGGRLDVRRRDEDGRSTFTATAWVPVRAGGA
ncbi:sensor histidine kinase [Jiangella alba]|uniref:histidine kinase n=1 Tax=Jiangella alba TaxID=561176 RepID=A0A1H5KLC9_9ACTN|nr:histidine kinase [Jiangella alba]SEE65585.1 Signal transduction histidine kinase [Jiangella alba]